MILEKNQIAAAEAASGKTETQLMELAGKRCADTLLHEYPENDSFLILCGSGNNGGDGFVIARHCLAANRQVAIILMLDDIRTPAAIEARQKLPDSCLIYGYQELSETQFQTMAQRYDVIVDCVFGFNLLSFIKPLGAGSTIQDLEDFIVSNNLLPLGSLVFLLFCTRKRGWGWDNFIKEADMGRGLKFPKALRFYVSYILPLIVLIIFVFGYQQKFFAQ